MRRNGAESSLHMWRCGAEVPLDLSGYAVDEHESLQHMESLSDSMDAGRAVEYAKAFREVDVHRVVHEF